MLFRQIFIIIRIGYKLFCLSFFQLLHINIVRTTHQLVVFIQTDLKDVSFLYNNIITLSDPCFREEAEDVSPNHVHIGLMLLSGRK